MKFSIITCTYNSATLLKKNITSVKEQTYNDYEHIFVDAFSQDNSVALIKEYQKERPYQVKLFQFPPRGISAAMNEGIKKAAGDYIIHLHSDDSMFNKEVLADTASFLGRSSYDWIYGQINVTEENGKSIGVFPVRKFFQQNSDSWLGKYMLKFYNYIPHQAVFIKRKVFAQYGYFDEQLSSAMDPDLWLRIYRQTKWSFYPRMVSNYSVHPQSQTANRQNKKQNKLNFKIVQRRYLFWFEWPLASLITWLVEKKNRNYR